MLTNLLLFTHGERRIANSIGGYLEKQQKLYETEALREGPSLAQGFEQADTGGDGDIQALHVSLHGNVHQLIAMLPGQTPQARPLRPHNQRQRPLEVGGVKKR